MIRERAAPSTIRSPLKELKEGATPILYGLETFVNILQEKNTYYTYFFPNISFLISMILAPKKKAKRNLLLSKTKLRRRLLKRPS